MIKMSKNEGFVYDSYRRLIMMYADVVMEKALGLNKSNRSIRELMEKELESAKKYKGYKNDSNMKAKDWKALSNKYLRMVEKEFGIPFPDNHYEQLYGAIAAVFDEAVNQSFKTPGHVVSYAVAELGFGNNVVIDRCVTHGNLYLQRACTNNDFVDSRGLVQAGSRTMVKPTPRLKLNEVITDNTGGSTTIRYYDFVTVADAYVPVMKMSSFNVQEFTTEALSTGGPEY